MRQPERIECTRAEFAIEAGIWPSPDVIGFCVLNEDGTEVEREYVFTDEPYPTDRAWSFLTRRDLLEIAALERLYHLSSD